MEQRGNVFAIERSAGGESQNRLSRPSCAVRKNLRTRSIVRFAMRVPSYSAANRDDEYNVKTNNSRWPKTIMLVVSLLGLRGARSANSCN